MCVCDERAELFAHFRVSVFFYRECKLTTTPPLSKDCWITIDGSSIADATNKCEASLELSMYAYLAGVCPRVPVPPLRSRLRPNTGNLNPLINPLAQLRAKDVVLTIQHFPTASQLPLRHVSSNHSSAPLLWPFCGSSSSSSLLPPLLTPLSSSTLCFMQRVIVPRNVAFANTL